MLQGVCVCFFFTQRRGVAKLENVRERSNISSPSPALGIIDFWGQSSPVAALPDTTVASAVDIHDIMRLVENDDSSAHAGDTAATASAAVVGKDGTAGCTATGQEEMTAIDAAVEDDDSTAAVVPSEKAGVQEEQHESQQQLELITPCRILELVEVCRTTQENFRELIRFLGRTLSDPACVSASFALPRSPPGRDSTGNTKAETEARLRPPDVVGLNDGIPPSTTTTTTTTTILKSSLVDSPEDPSASCKTDAEAAPAKTRVDGNGTRSSSPASAAALANARGGGDGECEWRDRSPVGMDVKAAAEVWRLLVRLNVEGVTNAVLNALDSLAQTLLVQRFLVARETTGEAAMEATAAAAASGGADLEGDGGWDRGGGGGGGAERRRRDTNAELRAILLGEHAPFVPLDVGFWIFVLRSDRTRTTVP